MKSIVSLVFAFLLVFSHVAVAHQSELHNAGFCQKAETTADLVFCVGQHLDAESDYLKQLYAEILTVYEGNTDKISQLGDFQNQWLNFRDKICAFEATLYEGEALSRIQEISCKARMTADRSKHLKSILVALDVSEIPVFSSPARWVNVLINDYKDAYWMFSSRKDVDLDCDGVDEIALSGFKMGDDGVSHTLVAIADSGRTGRPKVSVLTLDDWKNCNISSDMVVTSLPAPKPEGEEMPKECQKRIIFKTENCGDFTLSLDKETDSYKVSSK